MGINAPGAFGSGIVRGRGWNWLEPCRHPFNISRMAIFTPDDRERLRDGLVLAAQHDADLCGAAHTGSAASSHLDRWSDIDLALCLKPTASYDAVVSAWTTRLYQRHDALAHVDVMRGPTLFRVFLLRNTLQVDLAFWPAEDFGAIGPNFRLIFGETKPPRPEAQSNPHALIGMAWLYALHVRSSLARGRVLQTDYMLSGMRNHVFELACLRCSVIAKQGRGLDDLPAAERDAAAQSIPRSLDPAELRRAFQNTMDALLREIQQVDAELENKLAGVLHDMVGIGGGVYL
jgi:hypothetical protein